MSVNALSNTQIPYVTSASSAQKPSASLWSQLGQSLKSGDLAGAQADFATLKQDYQQNHPKGSAGAPTGPLVADVKQLAQALQSGSLGDAQTAFDTLARDAKGIYTAGSSQTVNVTSAPSSGGVSVLA